MRIVKFSGRVSFPPADSVVPEIEIVALFTEIPVLALYVEVLLK